MLAEFHDFEDEALNNGGFLDICHMKNNNIVLSVSSDDLVELEFGGWCWTFLEGDRGDQFFVGNLNIWEWVLRFDRSSCNWFRSTLIGAQWSVGIGVSE